MKRVTSVVWQFFDRLEENNRCVAVLCKLCDCEYKYFGNTTNLRVHLSKKHPIQWNLREVGWDGHKSSGESALRANFDDDESTNQSSVSPKLLRKSTRANKDENVRYSLSVKTAGSGTTGVDSMPKIEIKRVEVLENSEAEMDHRDNEDSEATLNLVRQMHDAQGSDEEWLEEEYIPIETYQPKRKKGQHKHKKVQYRTIKHVTPPRVCPVAKQENTERKDEHSVFGEYIANKLRKLKEPQTRGNIQQLITTILWQAEYGIYDDPASVRRFLIESIQEVKVVQKPVNIKEIEIETVEADNHVTNQSVDLEGLPLVN